MEISDTLLQLSAKVLLANNTQERINLAGTIAELAKQTLTIPDAKDNIVYTTFLEFTKKEISKMPKNFKTQFIANGAVAKIRKRRSGKNSFIYEIRYRRNGYNIYAAAKDLDIAKEKFLQEILTADNIDHPKKRDDYMFQNIAEEWFFCKKEAVCSLTHTRYYQYYVRYIFPILKDQNIKTIRTKQLIEIMNQTKGKGRCYEDVRSILNQIFHYAEINGLIHNNPVRLVPFIRAERKNAGILTNAELQTLLLKLQTPKFKQYKATFLLQLFFGLRPCEVKTARIDGEFLISQNAKRKRQKYEEKRIPFCKEAKLLLTELPKTAYETSYINKVFHRIIPNKTQYSLRHTFCTKCQESVRQEIVNIWMGDSPERLIGKTYTHFTDEFMYKEMQKVNFGIMCQNMPQNNI